MRASVRRVGNSSGIILPKPVLTELGIKEGDELSLSLEAGQVILAPAKADRRAGWAESARDIAEGGDDALVWPEFKNFDDDRLDW
jgi:antitoxin MazE